MKEESYSLQDKLVRIYLKSGQEFLGIVEFISAKILVLEDEEGSTIIHREDIAAAKILLERKIDEEIEPLYSPEYESKIEVEPIVEFGINHYGSIIPEDMLQGPSVKRVETDFSISMMDLQEPTEKRGYHDTTKENSPIRKKNSK